MIVTYNWLKEFVDFDLAPEALAELLTMIGLEVEGVRTIGGGMDDVIVAMIQDKVQHPNADKLSLCRVDTGTEILPVVCGAQNHKAGDKVALARIGAVLPGDFRIKKSKIRGVESCGMLCSEKELGLAEESDGILVLSQDMAIGVPLFEAMGMKDTVFEIGLTPNRADCLSVVGIAREVGAKLGKRIKYPGHELSEHGQPIDEIASVRVDDPDLCPRYTARYLSGCSVGPSPAWMVNRLNAVGMRSINNVVDVTNYVLMEYGHPLHAFDYSLLKGGAIIVRRADDNELFRTLDAQDRVLESSDLTIRDKEKVVALAGIMGGENSEIADTTTDILLESACFEPTGIRRTSKRLGMHTESSHRFERGTDILVLPRALDRAAALIADIAGGRIAHGRIDVFPKPVDPRTIPVRIDRITQTLGIELSSEQVREIFLNLEFSVESVEPDILLVTVPTFRVDIEREIDLIEEVARINGYEKIPATMPKVRICSDRPTLHLRLERKVRNLLVAQGLSEVLTYSFIKPDECDRILLGLEDPRKNPIPILNPLTEEQSVMRTTLLPGLLDVAARNVSFRLMNFQIFEMRRVYLAKVDSELPDEPVYVAGLMSGARDPEGWNSAREPVDFYDVKGIIQNILDTLSINGVSFDSRKIENYFHPGKACTIYVGDQALGSFGELHPTLHETYGFEQLVYYFELDFEKLVSLAKEVTTVSPPPRYPDTFRDIAMLVSDETETGAVLECIMGNRIKELESVELFDLYTGPGIPSGHKSVAVRVRYRSTERTLTDEEVSRLHQRVIEKLVNTLNITIR